MAINRQKLFDIIVSVINKTGNDKRTEWPIILQLLRKVIFNDPTKNCRIKGRKSDWKGLHWTKTLFRALIGCGLPIGNLTSQLFSNIYLDLLDQFCKRILKCKHYGRYVDDFYIVAATKEELIKLIEPIRLFLKKELFLTLHPNKIWLHKQEEGVPFLGFILRNGKRQMSKRGQKKMKEKLTYAYAFENNPYKVKETVNAYKAYSDKFDDGKRHWFS